MKRNKYLDKYGWMHLRPDPTPDATENAPTFTGTNIVLEYMNGTLTEDKAGRFLTACCWLMRDGVWYTTPITPVSNPRFSRDNFTGVICALKVIIRWSEENDAEWVNIEAKDILSQVPLFHKNLDHPRDFVMSGYAKYPVLFFPLLPIISIALAVSCYQSHKVRGGVAIPKTDGKILAFILCHAFKLRNTFNLCNYFIREIDRPMPNPSVYEKKFNDPTRWMWGDWHNVFNDYYRNYNHPNVFLVRNLEEEGVFE